MLTTILPHELPGALDDAPAGCAILSLDCFDTLIWRTTHRPADVFADIGEHGGTPQQRIRAESRARSHAALHRRCSEASLDDIYRMLLPNASDEERARGVETELAAEARHCFAFGPTVALMREAKRRGWRVVIVSDTYLNATQLGALIAAVAGDEVRALIDAVLSSSAYGLSKSEGLFGPVLQALGVEPGSMLHLGDNPAADRDAPAALGIASRHLVQFMGETEQRLRLEAAVDAVLHAGRGPALAYQPHRAQLSYGEPGITDPAVRLGYSVLGPVLRSFNEWLREEARVIAEASAGRVHLLFLMRDGYLPLRVWKASGELEDVSAAAVEISRFTAAAASFTDRAAVDRYLERELASGEIEGIAWQFGFVRRETQALAGDPGVPNRAARFAEKIRQPRTTETIVQRSAAFADRLIRHVEKVAGPQPGDTLVLVDLGYHGSVQSYIEPLLRHRFGVEVAGRYLLFRPQEVDGTDKKGLFDGRHHDEATLTAMIGNVAPLEQLCTVAQGSVVDYRRDGSPIRKQGGIKAQQSDVRERVQQGCLAYVGHDECAMLQSPPSDHAGTRRRAAAATLARFMFLPTRGELEVLQRFEHDINLGYGETVTLFDPAAATCELRREGMLYLKQAERMFLPAELRGQGLSLGLSLMAHRRFGLDLRMSDFREGGVELPILIADGRRVDTASVEASRTHDGFWSAIIPVGVSRYAIGIQFGRLYEWVEIDSATFRPATALDDRNPRADRRLIAAKPSFEGLEAVSPRLMRCVDRTGFMMVPPPGGNEALILTVVFRPIVERASLPVDVLATAAPATAAR